MWNHKFLMKKNTESMPQCLYIPLKSIKMEFWGKKGLNAIENKGGSEIVQRKHFKNVMFHILK